MSKRLLPHHMDRLGLALLITLFVSAILPGTIWSAPTSAPVAQAGDWPTAEWKSISPEQLGMDSEALVKLFDVIKSRNIKLHSLLIIRHGALVVEAYFYPYTAEFVHDVHSCAKSFTSALLGIALDKGYIDTLDHKVLDFFPGLTLANPDSRKQAITLEHLLTMSSGLDWPELSSYSFLDEWLASRDWVKYVLDRPLQQAPGSGWNYNTGGVQILSAILQKTTGVKASAFARDYLFKPLGITSAIWPDDPNGITQGGMSLELTPRDMARLGYLYLRNGLWDGQQVVPAQWVNVSTQKHLEAVFNEDYGYLWWIQHFGSYAASGYGGQRILVLPELDLVVVVTADLGYPDMMTLPESLVQQNIIPAVKSDNALPENAQAEAQLETRIRALGQAPQLQAVAPFPDIAKVIDGKTYLLEKNRYGLKSLTLTFKDREVVVDTTLFDVALGPITVGLDGVYRMSKLSTGDTMAAKGTWGTENRFHIDAWMMEKAYAVTLEITFATDGTILVKEQISTGNLEHVKGYSSN